MLISPDKNGASDYASSASRKSLMSQMSHLSSPKIKLPRNPCFLEWRYGGTPPTGFYKIPSVQIRTNPYAHPSRHVWRVQSTRFSGGSTALTLVCRLPASSLAGTFKRCRRRISETYRTYGTYRTKVDRMANSFSADLLWCGYRPSIQRKKNPSDYASSAGCAKRTSLGRLSLTRAACILALSERQRS